MSDGFEIKRGGIESLWRLHVRESSAMTDTSTVSTTWSECTDEQSIPGSRKRPKTQIARKLTLGDETKEHVSRNNVALLTGDEKRFFRTIRVVVALLFLTSVLLRRAVVSSVSPNVNGFNSTINADLVWRTAASNVRNRDLTPFTHILSRACPTVIETEILAYGCLSLPLLQISVDYTSGKTESERIETNTKYDDISKELAIIENGASMPTENDTKSRRRTEMTLTTGSVPIHRHYSKQKHDEASDQLHSTKSNMRSALKKLLVRLKIRRNSSKS